MNIKDYEGKIEQITTNDRLTDGEKSMALTMLANEMAGVAWTTSHKAWADEVRLSARVWADKYHAKPGEDCLAGLIRKGYAKAKR